MTLVENFCLLFKSEQISISERVYLLELKINIEKKNIPQFADIISLSSQIDKRDKCKIEFETIIENNFTLSLSNPNECDFDKFIKELEYYDETISIMLSIDKTIIENKFSVYCFEQFSEYILKKNIAEMMQLFGKLLKNIEYLVFELFDSELFFTTQTLFFIGKGIDKNIANDIDRLYIK